MQRIIGFVLLLCCIFSLYTWVFESDTVVVSGAGEAVAKDEYGNSIDANGFVVPEYNDSTLSGDFYDAASKPLSFINDVASAFDSFRNGITDLISSAGALSDTLSEIFNFDEEGSWWSDMLDGSRGER